MDHANCRYLEAKRSVDERAFSRRVRDRLRETLPDRPRVLEAGCGTGLTVSRLLRWGITPEHYTGLDRDAGVIEFARTVRPAALRYAGYDVTTTETGGRTQTVRFDFETGDALTGFETEHDADLLIAQGFMDLVALRAAVSVFESTLRPGGLLYFPITFDGTTIFQPSHPADDLVERAYHEAIDAEPARDTRAGRKLLEHLQSRQGSLLAIGASDWIVRPRDGVYPDDEQYFLTTILNFVASALESTECPSATEWLDTRRTQLAEGDLTYVAHQYDLLYRADGELL